VQVELDAIHDVVAAKDDQLAAKDDQLAAKDDQLTGLLEKVKVELDAKDDVIAAKDDQLAAVNDAKAAWETNALDVTERVETNTNDDVKAKKTTIKTKAAAKEDEFAVTGFTEPDISKVSPQSNSPSPLMRRKLADETRNSKSREGDAFRVTKRAEDSTKGNNNPIAL
jgi:hypothetical protein